MPILRRRKSVTLWGGLVCI